MTKIDDKESNGESEVRKGGTCSKGLDGQIQTKCSQKKVLKGEIGMYSHSCSPTSRRRLELAPQGPATSEPPVPVASAGTAPSAAGREGADGN